MSNDLKIAICPNCRQEAKQFGNVLDCYSCGESFKLQKNAIETVWIPNGRLDKAIEENEPQEPIAAVVCENDNWLKRNINEFLNWVIE